MSVKIIDRWKLAEVKGALHSLLLKVDVLTADSEEMEAVQTALEEALEVLEAIA